MGVRKILMVAALLMGMSVAAVAQLAMPARQVTVTNGTWTTVVPATNTVQAALDWIDAHMSLRTTSYWGTGTYYRVDATRIGTSELDAPTITANNLSVTGSLTGLVSLTVPVLRTSSLVLSGVTNTTWPSVFSGVAVTGAVPSSGVAQIGFGMVNGTGTVVSVTSNGAAPMGLVVGVNTALVISATGDISTPLKSYFIAVPTGSVTIATTPGTYLNFPIIESQRGAGYSTSTSTYTCPMDGLYEVNLQVHSNGGGSNTLYMLDVHVYTNDALWVQSSDRSPAAAVDYGGVSIVIDRLGYLTNGTSLRAHATAETAARQAFGGAQLVSWFSVRQL